MITDKNKIDFTWKKFEDMVDSHIAFISEKDEEKQKLFKAVHEYKTYLFQEKVREVYGQN